MFTPGRRTRLLDALVSAARQDAEVTAAALVGSGARGNEDAWSDIDLALRLAPGVDADAVVDRWTARMAGHGAVDFLDIRSGGTLYRVFLLADTLQVDLSFWPHGDFGATGPAFRLIYGSAVEREPVEAPEATRLIGMAWLYALHARSSLGRGQVWQAEYMISGVRDRVLALICLRHGVPAVDARGIDDVPAAVTSALAPALARSLEPRELARAFSAVIGALLDESALVDAELTDRIAGPLREMAAVGGP